MAAVEITISGVLFDKLNRTTQQVVLIGEASLTGLGVGGGPIIPPGQPLPPGVPTHPIYYPPEVSHPIVLPGDPSWPPGTQPPLVIWGPPDMPPGFWGGGMGPGVKPQPPFWPSDPPPPPTEGVKPPPPGGGWGYHPEYGWGYFPGGGKPQPASAAKKP